MYTFLILIYGSLTIGFIVSMRTHKDLSLYIGAIIACVCTIIFVGSNVITKQVSKPTEVATPAKYTNQTYYISNNERLYIQQNDTTKPFGEDISSKIEYKGSAKEPSIEFKTVKSLGEFDKWIPFKFKKEVKTSISKVILPKSTLTSNLTKVNVLNTNQSESVDISLAD